MLTTSSESSLLCDHFAGICLVYVKLNVESFYVRTIRIYHECEDRIEKSVPRIAVWHHEASRVMTNGDPEERMFLSYPRTNNVFFFLLTTAFID